MSKIKKGDQVVVITGKDKGRTGSVLRVLKKKTNPKAGFFVVVENINVVKKCVKANPQKGENGGIISKEMAMPISNVGLVDPTTQKLAKVGLKFLDDGKKVRYFKASGEVIDV